MSNKDKSLEEIRFLVDCAVKGDNPDVVTTQINNYIKEQMLSLIGENWKLYPPGQKYRGKLTLVKKGLNEQYIAVNSEKERMRQAINERFK